MLLIWSKRGDLRVGDNMLVGCRKILVITLILTFITMPLFGDLSFAEEKKPLAMSEKIAPTTTTATGKAQSPAVQTAVKAEEPSAQGQGPTQGSLPIQNPVGPGDVNVEFKGADIRTVLKYIAEVSGADIVVDPKVPSIAVDLKLTNKPWKYALEVIVKNYGLTYDDSHGVIRVMLADQVRQQDLSMHTYKIYYGNAKNIAFSIAALLKTTSSDRDWVASTSVVASAEAAGVQKGTEKSVGAKLAGTMAGAGTASYSVSTNLKIAYDDRTNSISVLTTPDYIEKVGKMIKSFDTISPQVMIEAMIIETVLGSDEKLGIDWNVKITASGAKIPTTAPFDYYGIDSDGLSKLIPLSKVTSSTAAGTTAAGAAAANIQPILVPAADFPTSGAGTQSFPFALMTDFKFGTLDFTEFKAVLEFLKSRKDTDTVSNPRIATLNNYLATINVGEVVYLPKFERNSQTGKMEITGYDTQDAGVVLNVVPRVNDNNEIALELFPQIIDYLGTAPIAPGSDIYAPSFRVRQAKTQVMIKNGETIFIGGLISERNVDRRTKLPFIGDMLGDVPYLGLLVSHKDIVKQRVEMIFFITVTVMTLDNKELSGAPLPNKAYVPIFTDTQRGNTAKNKKRLKKEY